MISMFPISFIRVTSKKLIKTPIESHLAIDSHRSKSLFMKNGLSTLSIATAGLRDEQLKDVNHNRFPRVDYLELKRLLNTELIDYSSYENHGIGEVFRKLETRLRSDVYLATLGWRKSHSHKLVFAWSERAGIPFAAYKRYLSSDHCFVTMFQCWSDRQESVIKNFNLLPAMDKIVVHCQSMKDVFVELGAPEDRVKVIHYSIDQKFFSPSMDIRPVPKRISSVGESRSRNYAALFEAVEGLPVSLEVAGYGHWYAREKSSAMNGALPENVSLSRRLSHFELRGFYASSQFIVIPIQDLVYSAGATVTLEAGAMARAVVAFRSAGIKDYIVDGETGILVEPGNVKAMRDAIQYLLSNPVEAKRLGDNARQRIVEELNLESYVGNIAELLTTPE
jgi:glycosyltransferase involved in cell wall biosynthesis